MVKLSALTKSADRIAQEVRVVDAGVRVGTDPKYPGIEWLEVDGHRYFLDVTEYTEEARTEAVEQIRHQQWAGELSMRLSEKAGDGYRAQDGLESFLSDFLYELDRDEISANAVEVLASQIAANVPLVDFLACQSMEGGIRSEAFGDDRPVLNGPVHSAILAIRSQLEPLVREDKK